MGFDKAEKDQQEQKQAKGKITRTSENDHIGKMSAPECWQGEKQQPDPRASLLWLCLEAKPKINTAAALRLWLAAPPTTGPAISPPTKPRKGKGKEIFCWYGRVKINILSSQVSPTLYVPFGFYQSVCVCV